MNLRNQFYKPALIGLAVVLFCGVSQMQQWLNRDRQALGFTKLAPLENAPPVLAFTTVALGGFRGLIANALWIRATELQDDDKFFEMVQLSDWITKLEPHFTQVWIHQAWNMAYNISVKFKDPADRWRWLQRGIQLLRDDGLRFNPDEALIYRELSWMFQQKMGQNLDDAHQFYKQSWAGEMQQVFHGNANFSELINPTTPEAAERARILREKYKMDPKLMQEVDLEYGPLEWRLPDAHAIYWAELGRRKAGPKDQETLRRSVYQSMQQASYTGGLTTNRTAQNTFVIGPNFDLVPKVSAAYEKMISEDPTLRDNMQRAHRNFLKTVVYFLYADGRMAQAEKWYAYIKKKYPESLPATLSLDDYAIQQITSQIGETDQPKSIDVIEGYLRNSYVRLALEEDDQALAYDRMAQGIWNHYESMVTKDSKVRIGLPPIARLKEVVLGQLLDSETGLAHEYAAVLRTKLNLPAPGNAPAASTNAPPASGQ